MFGAHAPCPIRLTSVDSVHGWSAAQHARLCADVEAMSRAMPLAVMTVQINASSVTLVSYIGRNGAGSIFAPTLTYTSATQPCKAIWLNSYKNEFDEESAWSIKHGISSVEYAGSKKNSSIRQIPGSTNSVDLVVEAGATTPYRVTIVIYGSWGHDRRIGEYGGSLDKTDNTTESVMPYSAQVYLAMKAARGSAYTDKDYSLVGCENLAISRFMSAVFYRTPEKFSANATPARATEKLDYWVEVLGVPRKSTDQDWELRERCAVHFEAALGPTLSNVTEAVRGLLGDAYVDLYTYYTDDFDTPPIPTFWNAGDDDGGAYSLGGHTWLSRRAHIRIETIEPPGMTRAEFLNLMNVQLFQLLDPMLPSWCTYNWSVGSDGFKIGIDKIGIDSI